MADISDLIHQLQDNGQEHLADYLSKVTPDSAKESLAQQLLQIDLTELSRLIDQYIHTNEQGSGSSDIQPASYYSLNGDWDREVYKAKGESLISEGKVSCFTVAGGQGSRLGFEGPKGCYPTSCIREHSLFQMFAESILASNKKYQTNIPWYIMTSPLNHDQTVAYFEKNAYFGLNSDDVMFFQQGTMPSLNAQNGQILLTDPITIATNPDGHGGAFKALKVSGALADMQSRGIEHMSYFQVDNPHAMLIDPVFIGLHAFAEDSSGEFSSKMVAKSSWDEKVGVFCEVDGATQIIEYSDLAEDLAQQQTTDGSLAFNAGSIAIHAISVSFIDRVTSNTDYMLPFHKALKKVSHFDLSTGLLQTPDTNNAVKLEKFVFDGIPIAQKSIVMETDRVEEFAPVKNASGSDSIITSKEIQTLRAAHWLEQAGVSVPRDADGQIDAVIEISPITALCAEDLKSVELPSSIDSGSRIVL